MLENSIILFESKNASIDPELAEIIQIENHILDTDNARASQLYEKVLKAAEAGSAFAMCICFSFAWNGWGQPQSNEYAFKWAKKSALAKYPPGYYLVGSCYENGIGVLPNNGQAQTHYALAAQGGFGFAACHLAKMYHEGLFGEHEKIKAIEYAVLADQADDPMASLLLAHWYETGEGVILNHKEAAQWYTRAAELGNFFASLRLKRAYENGELGLPKNAELAGRFDALFESQVTLPPRV